ncbi:MAG TPA: methionyl-tRNA formyltransferase [Steroidobacteraceae bacterium]|jgi:methionyl-tRNA formyltransferase
MLRIAFAGTPEFAVPTLQALARSSHGLVGVLTRPDRPAGRGRALTASPIKQLAQQLQLPLAQPQELRSAQAHAALQSWAPDLLVVVAYGLILPTSVLALPRLGCINVHASLLPRWRGAAPIQRAILAGDPQTGITIMQIVPELDAGPILAQQPLPIGPAATAGQLQDQLATLGAAALLATLAAAEHARLQPRPQPAQGITYANKIDKRDADIDWRLAAVDIDRRIRALNPAPVAQTLLQGRQLRIWEAQLLDERGTGDAGEILGLEQDRLLVQCGTGRLGLTRLQLAGRRVVSGREFFSAQRSAGLRLG